MAKKETICKTCETELTYLIARCTATIDKNNDLVLKNVNYYTCPYCGDLLSVSKDVAIHLLKNTKNKPLTKKEISELKEEITRANIEGGFIHPL